MKWGKPWRMKDWTIEEFNPPDRLSMVHKDGLLTCELRLPPVVLELMRNEYRQGHDEALARVRMALEVR